MREKSDDEIYYSKEDLELLNKLIDWGDGSEYIRAYDVIMDLTKLFRTLFRPSVYNIQDLEIVKSGKYDWKIVSHFLNEIDFTQQGHSVAHKMDEEVNLKIDKLIDTAPMVKLISKTKFALYDK